MSKRFLQRDYFCEWQVCTLINLILFELKFIFFFLLTSWNLRTNNWPTLLLTWQFLLYLRLILRKLERILLISQMIKLLLLSYVNVWAYSRLCDWTINRLCCLVNWNRSLFSMWTIWYDFNNGRKFLFIFHNQLGNLDSACSSQNDFT